MCSQAQASLCFTDHDPKGGYISSPLTKYQPSITWPSHSRKLYTMFIIDEDNPYPEPWNTQSPYIHWMVVNIPGSRLWDGREVLPYLWPSPEADSPPHRFKCNIYSQAGTLPLLYPKRSSFPLDKFVEDSTLTLVESIPFTVGYR